MQYFLLDSGNRKKLELVGPYKFVRPSPAAVWKPHLPEKEWIDVNAIYERSSEGGGSWKWIKGPLPKLWSVDFEIFKMNAKTTDFGHLGFFPEQFGNWQWLAETIKKMPGQVNTLNLFAYSGASSLAMASAGASVCHVDAAKGMVEWARDNHKINNSIPDKIRWITDDVFKFVNREIRRGSRYNGIVLDPPSFGRGSQGQVWKMEEGIIQLLEGLRQITDTNKPFFILLSCHSQGFSPLALGRMLNDVFPEAREISSGEMTIPEQDSKRLLPAGFYARIFRH